MKKIIVPILLASFLAAGFSLAAENGLKVNFMERFRFEGWDNTVNLDGNAADTTGYTRQRTSLTLTWIASPDIELLLKLTNESRFYLAPKYRGFEWRELVFDNLYFKWKNVAKLPLTLTLGRQNIIFGEGFLFMDGNPLTGSRTIYFNAMRGDYRINPHHTLTLLYCYMPTTDNLLPVIKESDWPNDPLVEQPETGYALYYTGEMKRVKTEAYLIRKERDEKGFLPASGIDTVGGRLTIPLSGKWSLTSEGAFQFGTYGDFDRAAFGGYFHLDFKPVQKILLLKTLTLGGIYLSGDDPATPDMEGWDPLFSRWPKWSESYIYTMIRENGVAYWCNFNSLYLSMLLDLGGNIGLNLTYHHLGAEELKGGVFPGGTGKTRGDLFMSKLDFRINAHTSGHLLWEHFSPGNFYLAGADSYNWLRFELLFSF